MRAVGVAPLLRHAAAMEPRWMVVALGLVGLVAGCDVDDSRERVAEHGDAVIDGEAEPDAYGFPLSDDVKNAMIAVTRDGAPLCSGTIIGDRLVVSAGHCFVANSQAWVGGADPEPLSTTGVAALEVRVGSSIEAPECVFGVAEAILNPELALRDLETEGGHANPHDSAVLVLAASVFETCPGVWPARARLEPLSDAIEGQEGLQGGFGAITENGLPTNYLRWWSHFTIEAIHELDVEVKSVGGSHVWFGDSGSGVLLPTEDGGVEVIGAVSNTFRHARLDIDAAWLSSLFGDGALCGPTAQGACVGDSLVTCAPETGFARVDCTATRLTCVTADDGAQCGCACDPCDESCECSTEECEEGAGGGEPSDDDGDGCAVRSPTRPHHAPLMLMALLAWLTLSRTRTRSCTRTRTRNSSPSAERLHQHHAVLGHELAIELECLIAIDEEPHVLAHRVLLVDHAKANARIAPVEIEQELGERGAGGLDFGRAGVRQERAGNVDAHGQPSSAVSTE